MADFAKVAKEVFQVLRAFNYTVKLYDADGTVVVEPEQARRFFSTKPRNLMVSIIDDDDNSRVNLFYGKSTNATDVMGLIQTLKEISTKYALVFSAQQYEKEIEPKDYSSLAAITERKNMINTTLIEGMYGTTRSSYLRLENARMIVRHSKKIDKNIIGARGRCVESIFIENASGERLLFPSTQIAPARAMTQHVNQGGTFADQVGEQIMRMTSDYANLGQAASYISSAGGLEEGATHVREACRSGRKDLRKTFERLSKHSTYAKEAASVLNQASILSETEDSVDETRINEVKRLLNDADLPHSVYECACKAMDKMKKEEPITEEAIQPTISVLGHRVNKQAWDKFKLGELDLDKVPDTDFSPGFRDYWGEVCYKLANLATSVKDDSLANLFGYVSDILEDKARLDRPDSQLRNKDSDWKITILNMKKIAKFALKAAGIPVETTPLMTTEAIIEYMDWLGKFDPDKILSEDFGSMDTYSSVSDYSSNTANDEAEEDAIDNFDPEDFIQVSDITEGKEAENPHENVIGHDEIMDALQEYLRNYIESNSDEVFEGDLTASAKAVYDDACEALQNQGYVVENNFNAEDGDESWRDELPELDLDENILSPEDIMIPKADQGNSLVKDVTKQVVKDPDSNKYRKPDSDYIERLQSLGWRTAGPQGQAY